ncbi:glycolate oxidase subunit GlcF [Elioraea sp. Yellowstone]|uniref:glycolate oxidase subunit GlcF n=1 Tax=Elioraea sp. Yellowstone TaxID=2592070 RepID=UPI00114D8B47|nr:glycolate oxidase subunit GlcF [Elioraea sp. Yellowstone]TQF78810.1 glycolate oxidase subunit GlcF [Elioraea sp. Yellowstone]
MQTAFTPEQLRDADTAEANRILRTCVHCGFCTATCPTFVLLGDELDSPRGRIYLIKEMLEQDRPATAEIVPHIDRCLSCLSCMTTCPSGVHYMHLIDHARRHVEETYRRPLAERALRSVLALVLPRVGLFRLALLGARVVKPLAWLIPGQSLLAQRLRAMLSLAPARLPPRSALERPRVHPAQGARRARVALLAGCAQQVLAPEINAATIRLLTRLGVEVVVHPQAGCCGALVHHMGRHAPAIAAAKRNVAAWAAEFDAGGVDAVVINASGCGTTVKDYGFMLRGEPDWAERAARISALARDITEFLSAFGYAPTRPPTGLRVTYHAACSLQHGQKITALPKALLTKAGFLVADVPEGHLCCGSAGTYNLLQPAIAERLRARKLDNIRATRPDLVAAGNVGCLVQLAGAGIPMVHTVELLDWMAGGPVPGAIAQLVDERGLAVAAAAA